MATAPDSSSTRPALATPATVSSGTAIGHAAVATTASELATTIAPTAIAAASTHASATELITTIAARSTTSLPTSFSIAGR